MSGSVFNKTLFTKTARQPMIHSSSPVLNTWSWFTAVSAKQKQLSRAKSRHGQNSYSEAVDNGLAWYTNWKTTRWKIMKLFGSNLDSREDQ